VGGASLASWRKAGFFWGPMPGFQKELSTENAQELASGAPQLKGGRRLGNQRFGFPSQKAIAVGIREDFRDGDGDLTCLCSVLSWSWMNCKTQGSVGELCPAPLTPLLLDMFTHHPPS
jgi:hypothetical protein